MNQDPHTQSSGFSGLGITPSLLETLGKLGYKTPTPIQEQAIPIAITGKDLVGVAQTGTGKTLAFGIPMIQRLEQLHGCGLVILPTRELAIQVDESLRQIGARLGLKTAVLIGGTAIRPQARALKDRPHIIVGTPGRINDHLNQHTLRLDTVSIVVLDEADRMLDMGFAPQIQKIFKTIPVSRQTMLFSATMPPEIMRMAETYMQLPIRIEIARSGTTADRVTQEIFVVSKDQKIRLMEKLLGEYNGPTLIFTRTKHGSKKLTRDIRDIGHKATELHSNRSTGQRRESVEGFKSGRYRILVATDIASRGIDVSGIELIINFDLPTNTEDYVHRIGRTARAGASGHAISFVAPEQEKEFRAIERLIRKTIPISKLPQDLPPARIQKFVPNESRHPFSSRPRRLNRPSFKRRFGY